jgi:Na+/H+-dicarboxylate symporter
VVTGVVLGSIINSANGGPIATAPRESLGLPGELFMRALKCMVLPLIIGSAFGGVLSLQGAVSTAKGARGLVRRTLVSYALSMQCAVAIGITVMSVFKPGRGVVLSTESCSKAGAPPSPPPAPVMHLSPTTALLNTLRSCVPPNVVAALAGGNVLGLLCLSIATAVAIGKGEPETAAAALAAVKEFNAVVARMVTGILRCTPIGICSLIAAQIAGTCHPLTLLIRISYFIAVYLLGLVLHAGVVIPAALRFVGRVSPMAVFKGALPAITTVFATDSSSATLPVTLMCCRDRLHIPEHIVNFVIPLGTTVNMDGTALYEATAVLFIAQVHGVQLGFVGTIVVALTATLAAVGAPAIPAAGLVTMLMVLSAGACPRYEYRSLLARADASALFTTLLAVGMDEYASDIAVLLACDWFLDRCRSVVNVVGDVACCVIVSALTDRADERERAAAAAAAIAEPAPEA